MGEDVVRRMSRTRRSWDEGKKVEHQKEKHRDVQYGQAGSEEHLCEQVIGDVRVDMSMLRDRY